MISKFTNSLRVYGGAIAIGHILLFMTMFPTTSLILFFIFVPCAYITIIMALIHEVHKASGFTDQSLFLSNTIFLAPDMSVIVVDSPLDIDYDIGIH
jgi:hypothetical protein